MPLSARYEVRATVYGGRLAASQVLLLGVTGFPEQAGVEARAVYDRSVQAMQTGAPEAEFWSDVILEGPNGLFERTRRRET
jgi:hypothetical protein